MVVNKEVLYLFLRLSGTTGLFVVVSLFSACSRNGALWNSYSESLHRAIDHIDSDSAVFKTHFAAAEEAVAELELSRRISGTEISNAKGCLTSLRQYRQAVARDTAIAIGREIESCLKTAEMNAR